MPSVQDLCYEANGIFLAESMGRWTRTQVPAPLESILNVPPSSRTLSLCAHRGQNNTQQGWSDATIPGRKGHGREQQNVGYVIPENGVQRPPEQKRHRGGKNCGRVADRTVIADERGRSAGHGQFERRNLLHQPQTNSINGVRYKECEISDAEPRWQGFNKSKE
jgi:hypothetical protein